MADKKLYRSASDKKIAGVCAGIAKYFDIDPTIVRIIWAAITLAGGSGIIAYIVCMFVMPEEPEYNEANWTDVEE